VTPKKQSLRRIDEYKTHSYHHYPAKEKEKKKRRRGGRRSRTSSTRIYKYDKSKNNIVPFKNMPQSQQLWKPAVAFFF